MMNTKVILGNMLLLCLLQLVNLVLTPFVLSGSDSFFPFFFRLPLRMFDLCLDLLQCLFVCLFVGWFVLLTLALTYFHALETDRQGNKNRVRLSVLRFSPLFALRSNYNQFVFIGNCRCRCTRVSLVYFYQYSAYS